ncbi:MAG TPA: protein-methionine-sulfoxide reductase heme-binding subunit MsrQ [Stellaceae bacterium]|nr:protein-methionine-sulfoxide reductase heme-binding subunit MsrQ [Stellaceae bacterium]
MKLPWYDYQRRLSPLKLTVFIALFLPAAWTALAFATNNLGAQPFNEAIHQQGLWTIRLILIALAITPLKAILQWQRLILVRRMVGVGAFAYILLHLTLYIADQKFNLVTVASEIVKRIYLTIGFIALLGLATLAATSTDRMVRRLGRKWQSLHRLVYLICILGLIHYSMQSKLEQWEPTIADGIFVWLMGYRLLAARFAVRGRLGLAWVAGLGVVATILTSLGETLYFYLAFHVDPLRILSANFSLQTGVRPAAVVFGFSLIVLAAGLARERLAPPPRGSRPGRTHFA